MNNFEHPKAHLHVEPALVRLYQGLKGYKWSTYVKYVTCKYAKNYTCNFINWNHASMLTAIKTQFAANL